MRIVDTRGQQCPAPIIATKKALREAGTGEILRVLTDSRTSLDNLSRFLRDNNIAFEVKDEDGHWSVTLTTGNKIVQMTDAEEYCTTDIPHFTQGNFIVVFSSDKMGDGDDELGHLLMTNFIKAIKDLDHLPEKMIFYNRGVYLGSDDSPVVIHLKELEKMGTGILFCATCAKFYSLEEKIKIGSLSNMYEIAQVMASAGNIVKP